MTVERSNNQCFLSKGLLIVSVRCWLKWKWIFDFTEAFMQNGSTYTSDSQMVLRLQALSVPSTFVTDQFRQAGGAVTCDISCTLTCAVTCKITRYMPDPSESHGVNQAFGVNPPALVEEVENEFRIQVLNLQKLIPKKDEYATLRVDARKLTCPISCSETCASTCAITLRKPELPLENLN